MELASRDVISRAEQTEIDEGRGIDGNVMLDLRHLGAERILERLHGTRELVDRLRRHRPDLRPDPGSAGRPLPDGRRRHGRPARTELDGLYAAGEVACVSVHGANRLGGNALMETIIFGRRAGATRPSAAQLASTPQAPRKRRARRRTPSCAPARSRSDGERPWRIRDELAASMHENFGVFRREEQMAEQGRRRERSANDSSASSSKTRETCSTAI